MFASRPNRQVDKTIGLLVIFDVFFRQNPCNNGYSVCAGLDQVIDYIKNLHFTYEDVD